MYDMYPWNEPGSGASHDQDQHAAAWLPAPREGAPPREGAAPRNGTRGATSGDDPADFSQAVQFALDRRDNGGAAAATPPAVSLTRQ